MKKIADTLGITELVKPQNSSVAASKPEKDKEQELRTQLAAANAKADVNYLKELCEYFIGGIQIWCLTQK